jgi:hypothetical protein
MIVIVSQPLALPCRPLTERALTILVFIQQVVKIYGHSISFRYISSVVRFATPFLLDAPTARASRSRMGSWAFEMVRVIARFFAGFRFRHPAALFLEHTPHVTERRGPDTKGPQRVSLGFLRHLDLMPVTELYDRCLNFPSTAHRLCRAMGAKSQAPGVPDVPAVHLSASAYK